MKNYFALSITALLLIQGCATNRIKPINTYSDQRQRIYEEEKDRQWAIEKISYEKYRNRVSFSKWGYLWCGLSIALGIYVVNTYNQEAENDPLSDAYIYRMLGYGAIGAGTIGIISLPYFRKRAETLDKKYELNK